MNTALDVASEALPVFERIGEPERLGALRILAQRLAHPATFATLIGETSTGKSTLINGLLGRKALPFAVKPTTGTVVHVACREDTSERRAALNRNGTLEPLDDAAFERLCLKPDDDLLRLLMVTQPGPHAAAGLNVFDTPGYNALLAEHEEVLRAFIPQSDVVIFVVGYRTGFGQADQDLLEFAVEATSDDEAMPFVLCINRAPEGTPPTDARVAEIASNATDCIGRAPTLVLVETTGRARPKPLPNVASLGTALSEVVDTPERLRAVERKLGGLLLALIEEARDSNERRLLVLQAAEDDAEFIQEQRAELDRAKRACHTAVDDTIAELNRSLPAVIDRGRRALGLELDSDIGAADKWTDKDNCAEWVAGHALPFGVRKIGKAVEEEVFDALQRLDRRIDEIANTAVQRVAARARVRSDAVQKLMTNVQRTVGMRLGGAAVQSVLRGLGGVGGTAAGAGNLVKMIVSRAGRLIGKTFGREIYNQIGRTFTKRFMQRLNVVITVGVEVFFFVRDANRWRGELVERVDEALDKWTADVKEAVVTQQLERIAVANHNGVDEIFADLLEDDLDSQAATKVHGSLEERLAIGEDLDRLLETLRTKEHA